MKTKRAYQYRFYPTDAQAHNLAQTFGCCRFVYNTALQKRKRSYFDHGVKVYHKDLSAMLTAMKKEDRTAWLRDVSSVPLQQALRHLDRAFVNFFEGRAAYPTLKKKHGEQVETRAEEAGSRPASSGQAFPCSNERDSIEPMHRLSPTPV